MKTSIAPAMAGVCGVLMLAGTAAADLVNVTIETGPFQHPDGLHDTWRIVAHFNNNADQIAAVVGLPDWPLFFMTGGGELYNQAIFSGSPLNDFPSVGLGGEAWDSYVTIGATTFPSGVQFTPGFLGHIDPWPLQVIVGSAWGPEFDGGWFLFEPGSVGKWDGDVVIAQFTVDKGVGFLLQGNVSWVRAGGVPGTVNTPFFANNIPVPGALALLGLAGLASVRRRRG